MSDPQPIPDDEKRALIALNMVQGIGGKRVRRILSSFDSARAFLEAGPMAWKSVHGIGDALSTQLSSVLSEDTARREMERAEDLDIDLVTFREPGYPSLLRRVHDHPVLLSVRGNQSIDVSRSLAIVGTRGCTYYGRKQAKRFATMLAYRGFTVVSGLARGIDTHAHRGTLQGGGDTIAVLGNGLGQVYPRENEELAGEVTESGALVSELPIDAPPEGRNFPQRNRIISGLSLGVLVVEAPGRSGALITTDLALEQNREVFALPGNVDSPKSEGCNRLIQQGAVPVMDVDDILEHLPRYATEDGAAGRDHEGATEAKPGVELDDEREQIVYEQLSSEPQAIDEISGGLDLNSADVSSILTKLEMRGLAEQHPGKRFTTSANPS